MFLAPPVFDVRLPAAPAARLLPELGRVIGRRLEASTPVANMVLFVHGRGLDPDLVMESLAKATLGRWVTSSDGVTRLAPDPILRRDAERKEETELKDKWRKTFASFRERAAKMEPADWKKLAKDVSDVMTETSQPAVKNPWERMRKLDGRSAEDRLKVRMVAALPVEPFLNAPEYGFALSDKPTRAQFALPPAAMAAYKAYVSEKGAYADAAAPYDFIAKRNSGKVRDYHETFDSEAPPVSVARLVMRIGKSRYNPGAFSLRLRGYAVAGESVLDRKMDVSAGEDGSTYVTDPAAERKYAAWRARIDKSPEYEPSPLAKAYRSLLGAGSPNRAPVPEAERARVFRPDLEEPLAVLVGESMAAWSEWRKRPVIGWLTDDLARNFYYSGTKLGALDEFSLEEKAPESGPRLFTPTEPIKTLRQATDRKVLAWALRATTTPDASLEDRARLAFLKNGDDWSTLLAWMTQAVRNSLNGERWEHSNEEMMPLYGALTPDERRQALNGGIPLARLKEADTFYRRLYAPDADLQDLQSKNAEQEMEYGYYSQATLSREPTVRWPGGPPPNARVILEETTRRVLQAETFKEKMAQEGAYRIHGTEVWTPFDLGVRQASPPPEFGPEMTAEQREEYRDKADYSRMHWGFERKVKMRIIFDPETGIGGLLSEKKWKSKTVPIAELPKDIQEEIAKGAASVKKG